jgi:hypothetical protein
LATCFVVAEFGLRPGDHEVISLVPVDHGVGAWRNKLAAPWTRLKGHSLDTLDTSIFLSPLRFGAFGSPFQYDKHHQRVLKSGDRVKTH